MAKGVHDVTQEMCKELFFYKEGMLYWHHHLTIYQFRKQGKPAGSLNKGRMWVISRILAKKLYTDRKTVCVALNRLIWIWHYGAIPKDMVVDHKDRNPLNNKIENLRLVTEQVNSANQVGECTKKSKLPKGVYRCTEKGKYRFKVVRNGKEICKSSLTYEEACAETSKFFATDLEFVKESDLPTKE